MSGPCPRPECGGEVHTDGWGNPIRCPARRCPRCDCPDGAEQCEHCKVCPHADGGTGGLLLSGGTSTSVQIAPPPRNIAILGEDGRTPLVTIHPSGELEYGPGYTPDEAARHFWDALRRIAPARCPSCGHVAGGEVTP
jgi:hypothetical protein